MKIVACPYTSGLDRPLSPRHLGKPGTRLSHIARLYQGVINKLKVADTIADINIKRENCIEIKPDFRQGNLSLQIFSLCWRCVTKVSSQASFAHLETRMESLGNSANKSFGKHLHFETVKTQWLPIAYITKQLCKTYYFNKKNKKERVCVNNNLCMGNWQNLPFKCTT